jgi:hypothetical protein
MSIIRRSLDTFGRIISVPTANGTLIHSGVAAPVAGYEEIPGGADYRSADYEVTVQGLYSGGKTEPFVYFSKGADSYDKYDLIEGSLVLNSAKSYTDRLGAEKHSAVTVSIGGPTRVRVKVKPDAEHLTLPIQSVKVLPTSYGIKAKIVSSDSIEFMMYQPEKVAVVINYDQVIDNFETLASSQTQRTGWQDNALLTEEEAALKAAYTEGYKNPLFIIVLPEEENVPNKVDAGTLVVSPGTAPTQTQIDAATVVWFEPGVHDLSGLGAAPRYDTEINPGQTFYVEGGAYVLAKIRKFQTGADCFLRGRGIISGANHAWSTSLGAMIQGVDYITGLTLTDRACFSTQGGKEIEDCSYLGAWHGNNDGPDFLENGIIKNCLLLSHDDNLKPHSGTDADHLVIWQIDNGHPILPKEVFYGASLDVGKEISGWSVNDVDILCHSEFPVSPGGRALNSIFWYPRHSARCVPKLGDRECQDRVALNSKSISPTYTRFSRFLLSRLADILANGQR